jgi:hypothetical protein
MMAQVGTFRCRGCGDRCAFAMACQGCGLCPDHCRCIRKP